MAGVLIFARAICNTNHDIQASKEKLLPIKKLGARERIGRVRHRHRYEDIQSDFYIFNLMKTATYTLPIIVCASK
jgi:hypothetical protein